MHKLETLIFWVTIVISFVYTPAALWIFHFTDSWSYHPSGYDNFIGGLFSFAEPTPLLLLAASLVIVVIQRIRGTKISRKLLLAALCNLMIILSYVFLILSRNIKT